MYPCEMKQRNNRWFTFIVSKSYVKWNTLWGRTHTRKKKSNVVNAPIIMSLRNSSFLGASAMTFLFFFVSLIPTCRFTLLMRICFIFLLNMCVLIDFETYEAWDFLNALSLFKMDKTIIGRQNFPFNYLTLLYIQNINMRWSSWNNSTSANSRRLDHLFIS